MKKIIFIILLLGIVGAGVFLAINRKNIKISTPSTTPSKTSDLVGGAKEAKEALPKGGSTGGQTNFSKEGTLLDQRQDPEVERWTFLYEEPGNPALIVELKFNFQSKCDLGQGENICNTERFPEQLRVQIEGNRENDLVTVLKLKAIR